MGNILVTGAAGFIGFHVIESLLTFGHSVVGVDNINDYYDVELKYMRLTECGIDIDEIGMHKRLRSHKYSKYQFVKMDLGDKDSLFRVFENDLFDVIIHLAAQAGVRYSLSNPQAYLHSNVISFFNILEFCRISKVINFIYASSSSVYGQNEKIPFSVEDKTDNPVSFYAATKKSNELFASCYSHLFGIRTVGLRFFTVYGAWGRPDMAYFSFVKSILNRTPIKVFNNGELSRDFTSISDIVQGINLIVNNLNVYSSSYSESFSKVYNIGAGHPIKLMDFISTISDVLGIQPILMDYPMQAGDVLTTYADIDCMKNDFGYNPEVSLTDGMIDFVEWFLKLRNSNVSFTL